MGVRQSNYNSTRGTELLKLALMEREGNDTPGRTPSSMAQNAYFSSMPNTDEQEREADSYDSINAGRDARYEARQNENTSEDLGNATARAHGFTGGMPEEQAQTRQDAFRKLLIPAQAKAEQDQRQQAFDASQNDLNRQSREGIAARATAGQTNRTQMTQDTIAARQPDKRSGISKLMDWFSGSKQAPPATSSSANAGSVRMVDPDTGEQRDVDAAQVAQAMSIGLVKVQ